MRKIVCDKCGREIFEENSTPIYIGRACYKVDLCEGCEQEWLKKSEEIAKTYNEKIDKLYKERDDTLMDLIGIGKRRGE